MDTEKVKTTRRAPPGAIQVKKKKKISWQIP